jgi:hypothetical protein
MRGLRSSPVLGRVKVLGGDPDLADGGVGCHDEFAGAILEDDVHDAVVVFVLEGPVALFGFDERLLEGFEGTVGFAAEGGFVDHKVSVRDSGVGEEAAGAITMRWVSLVQIFGAKKGRPVKGGRPSWKNNFVAISR